MWVINYLQNQIGLMLYLLSSSAHKEKHSALGAEWERATINLASFQSLKKKKLAPGRIKGLNYIQNIIER